MPFLPTRVAPSWSPGSGGGGGGGVTVHNLLSGRSAASVHPYTSITGLVAALDDRVAVAGDSMTGNLLLTAGADVRGGAGSSVGALDGDNEAWVSADGHHAVHLADGDFAEMLPGTMQIGNSSVSALMTLLRLLTVAGGDRAWEWTADGRLTLGAAGDTNLYRAAADLLTTDDTFRALVLEAAGMTGSTENLRFVGGTVTGAPASGAHNVLDFAVSAEPAVYVCTVAGTPGTWVNITAALPIVQASSDIIPDAATNPGFISFDLAANPSCDALTLASHGTITSARLATIAALPACTYNNGASGVGATLTGDANGALADIDFATPVAGDRIVVANQASALQNGIYVVTTLGTGGTPFVLTRVPEADDAATWVDGITANISAGLTMRGARLSAGGVFTMGTTSIVWQRDKPSPTPTDALFGVARNRRRYASDFDEFSAAIVVAGGALQLIPGTRFVASLDGTGSQVVQTADTGSVGLADCQTGTTGTGFAGLISAHGMTFSSAAGMAWGCRLKTPVVSSGSETFIVRAGFMDFVSTTRPTAGAYFEIPSDGTSPILAVTRMSGTETATPTSPSVTQGTTYKSLAIIYDEVAGSWKFYAQVSGVMTLVATNTTNLPTGSLSPGASIDKSAGTTTRSLYVDVLTGDGPDTRILSVFP